MPLAADDEATVAHRRTSGRTVPPLVLVVCAFFLPTLRVCNVVETPADFVADGLVWIVPWYLSAFVVAAVTVVALIKLRAPARPGWIVAGIGVGCCACVALAGVVAAAAALPDGRDTLVAMLVLAGLLICLGASVQIVRRARAHHGWKAWTRLLLLQWVLLLPLVALLILFALDGGDSKPTLGIGAYVVFAAVAALGVVLAPLFLRPGADEGAA